MTRWRNAATSGTITFGGYLLFQAEDGIRDIGVTGVQTCALPISLREEDGVMIFSGSAVVDHRNTSGFGKDDKPPLVAIYTGHRSEERRVGKECRSRWSPYH